MCELKSCVGVDPVRVAMKIYVLAYMANTGKIFRLFAGRCDTTMAMHFSFFTRDLDLVSWFLKITATRSSNCNGQQWRTQSDFLSKVLQYDTVSACLK